MRIWYLGALAGVLALWYTVSNTGAQESPGDFDDAITFEDADGLYAARGEGDRHGPGRPHAGDRRPQFDGHHFHHGRRPGGPPSWAHRGGGDRGGCCCCCRSGGGRGPGHCGSHHRRGSYGHGGHGYGGHGRYAMRGGHGSGHGFYAMAMAAFKHRDKNGDGKVTKEEVLAQHAKVDTDGDGAVTRKELIEVLKKASMKMKSKGPDGKDKGGPGAGPHRRPGGFGWHGPRPGGGPPSPEAFFGRLDKDKDGKLTESEVPDFMWKRLSQADANKDGAVTKDELEKRAKARRSEKPAKPKSAKPKSDKPKSDKAETPAADNAAPPV